MFEGRVMQIWAGLGNPGTQYALHRHNVGFMATDIIAEVYGFAPWSKKFRSLIAEGRIGRERVLLMKPPGPYTLMIKERPAGQVRAKKKAAVKKARTRAAADNSIVDALKKWRLGVAKKEGVPAFRVMTDKVLGEIAEERPQSAGELLQIAGVGPRLASRYGLGILQIVSANSRN